MRLEDLQPAAAVRGILRDQAVSVVGVQWFGSGALELTYKTASDRVANELLYRDDVQRLEVLQQGRPWSFDGDGDLFRLVSEVARKQIDAEIIAHPSAIREATAQMPATTGGTWPTTPATLMPTPDTPSPPAAPPKLKRYHGTVALDPTRTGRDAGRIADEVLTHLVGLVGSSVRVTLEIDAEIPGGTPDNVVRIVTENSKTLKFGSGRGFEAE